MIEKSTLDALNYFIDEDIQNCKDSITESKGYENLIAYYNGQIAGLEYAKHLINLNWKSDRGMILNIDFDELEKQISEELKEAKE